MSSLVPINTQKIEQYSALRLEYNQPPIKRYFKTEEEENQCEDEDEKIEIDQFAVQTFIRRYYHQLVALSHSRKSYKNVKLLKAFRLCVFTQLIGFGVKLDKFDVESYFPFGIYYQDFVRAIQTWSEKLPKTIPLYNAGKKKSCIIYTPTCFHPEQSINPDMQDPLEPWSWLEQKVSSLFKVKLSPLTQETKEYLTQNRIGVNWLLCISLYNCYAYHHLESL